MDYTIYPYEGVGPIRFGMTPEQVHEKLGEPEDTTMKGAESPEFPTDAYDDLGLYVFYGESGRCEFVEFFGDGIAIPTFQGQTLIGRPLGELKSWLQSLKTDVQHYDCGLMFLKFGIDLYSQYYSPQDPGCLVEVVGIFASGYNDEVGIGYSREEAIDARSEKSDLRNVLVEGAEFMDYIIYPYEGVGPIRFGMTPEQVREKLGEPERTTMKEAESPEFPTDAYNNLGFHVFYAESGRCQAVEFFEDGIAIPTFQGQTLIGRPFGELKFWLQSLKTDVQHYDCGLIFLKFGINLYSQYYSPQDPGCLVETVGVSTSSYIDGRGVGYPREEAIDVCFEECDLSSVLVEDAEFLDYVIYPYEGVGPIRFGMTPEQVHEKLGEPMGTFMKGAESPFPTDAYDPGFHVHYDKSGRCEFVEFFEDGIASPTFQGQTLFGRPFGELESWLQSLKADVQHYDCGLIFLKFGISLYSEDYYLPHRDPGCFVEAVGVFASGYSDKIGLEYPRELVKVEFSDYVIYPYEGVGPIRFGMTPEPQYQTKSLK